MRAVLFDVFGTVVDWRTSVVRELARFGAARGIDADWPAVADDWRAEYQPSMEAVRSGRRPWVPLDTLHRESIERVLGRHGVVDIPGDALDELTLAWHRLDPWPDVVAGLTALRRHVRIGTLSNGNTALLENLARHADLPWDAVLGAETAGAYKPTPPAYLHNVELLGLRPGQVMLAAAHNGDLTAAAACGLQTAFIPRPTEHGPAQRTDLTADGDWDLVVEDIPALAAAIAAA